MRIRPYIPDKDYEYLSKWIANIYLNGLATKKLMPFGAQTFCHTP